MLSSAAFAFGIWLWRLCCWVRLQCLCMPSSCLVGTEQRVISFFSHSGFDLSSHAVHVFCLSAGLGVVSKVPAPPRFAELNVQLGCGGLLSITVPFNSSLIYVGVHSSVGTTPPTIANPAAVLVTCSVGMHQRVVLSFCCCHLDGLHQDDNDGVKCGYAAFDLSQGQECTHY